jgi:hypothetical protein
MFNEIRHYVIPKLKLILGYIGCLIGGWMIADAVTDLLTFLPGAKASFHHFETWINQSLDVVPILSWLGPTRFLEALLGLLILIALHNLLHRYAQGKVLEKFFKKSSQREPEGGTNIALMKKALDEIGRQTEGRKKKRASNAEGEGKSTFKKVFGIIFRIFLSVWVAYPLATFLLHRSTHWFPWFYKHISNLFYGWLFIKPAQIPALEWLSKTGEWLTTPHGATLAGQQMWDPLQMAARIAIGFLLVRALGVPMLFSRFKKRRGPLLRIVKFNYHTMPRRKISWLNWRLGRFPALQKLLDKTINRLLRRMGDFDIDLTTKVAEGIDPHDRILGAGTSIFFDPDTGERKKTTFYMAENLKERLRKKGEVNLTPTQIQAIIKGCIEYGKAQEQTINSDLLSMWHSEKANWNHQIKELLGTAPIAESTPPLESDDLDIVLRAIIALTVHDISELDNRTGVQEVNRQMMRMDLVGNRGRFLRIIYVPEGNSIVRHVVMEEDLDKEHARSKTILGERYPEKVLTSMKFMKRAGEMDMDGGDMDGGTEAYISADEIRKGTLRRIFQWGRVYKINNYHRRKYDVQSLFWASGEWLTLPIRWALNREYIPRRKLIVRDDATGAIVAEAMETWFAVFTKVFGNYNRILYVYDNGIENNEGFHNYGGQNFVLGISEFDRLQPVIHELRVKPGTRPLDLLNRPE